MLAEGVYGELNDRQKDPGTGGTQRSLAAVTARFAAGLPSVVPWPDVSLAANKLWAGVAGREVPVHAAGEAMPDLTLWLTAEVGDGETCPAVKVRFNAAPMNAGKQGNLFTAHNRTGMGLPLALELLSRMYGSIEYDRFAICPEITLMLPLAGPQVSAPIGEGLTLAGTLPRAGPGYAGGQATVGWLVYFPMLIGMMTWVKSSRPIGRMTPGAVGPLLCSRTCSSLMTLNTSIR